MTANDSHNTEMKYTSRIRKLLAMILIVATFVVSAFPQLVYAGNIKNSVISVNSVVLTTLQPNNAQEWAIAYKDGISYPGFFHDKVEKHIRNAYSKTIAQDELPIPEAGTYGFNGRADLYMRVAGLTYIWDVKPASNGYFPRNVSAKNQVNRYVNANANYRVGPNNVINNSEFIVIVLSPTGIETEYKVTYKNSIYNDGLIFYRFDRIGRKQEQEQPETVPVTVPAPEKDKAIDIIVNEGYVTKPVVEVDWGKAAAFVAIASAITASNAVPSQTSVEQALKEYSKTFLIKLGHALGKAGLGVGVVGIFATPEQVMAAEQNSENIDLRAVNDVLNEYETALEVLLCLDSIDELLDAYGDVDSTEMEELLKGIQDENDEYDEASQAQPPRDPLIIDLGETGIELCELSNGVNFDLDNNGYAEKTAWIGTIDGFLALDRNENGIIDNGGELFGDQVDIGDRMLSSSGFEALSILDENEDGVIDEKDDYYKMLLVWVDSNHNGYSEPNELNLLDYYGIKEIQLDHINGSVIDENTGTMMTESAKVVYQDNSETVISEFWFPVNASDTTHGDSVTAGNVPRIEQAVEKDQTGELALLIDKFIESESIESKRYYLKKILYFITDSNDIAVNSRGGNIDARDLHVIEQFMGRNFNGVGGSNPNANAANILKNIYKDIEDYYYNILNLYDEFGGYKTLMFQYEDENGNESLDVTCLVYVFQSFIEQNTDMKILIYDLGIYLKSYDKLHGTNYFADYRKYYQEMLGEISESVNAAIGSNTYIGTNVKDNYFGSNLKDFIFGEDDNDTLNGADGDDIIYGKAGNDTISGGAGNDRLYGNEGDDTLDGGLGNDIMIDDGGNDTYVFTKGYGEDTIIDNGGSNRISFTNLTVKDILVNGTGDYDATIKIKGTNDSLVIKNFCENNELADYTLVFKDKTMHCTDEESPFKHIYGTEQDDVLKAVVEGSIMNAFGGNDTVIGSDGRDIIYGNSGNDNITAGEGADVVYGGADDDYISGDGGDDILWGEEGNDTLDGGSGNDYLFGGAGDDTYVFAQNYGRDIMEDDNGVSTVKLGGELTTEDVSAYKIGDEAVIRINNTEDMLIISGYGAAPENYYIEAGDSRIGVSNIITDYENSVLNDMTVTNGTENSDAIFAENVKNLIASGSQYDYIVGNSDEDLIFGDKDTDRVIAGAGNDIIYGGDGDDELFGDDDNDVICGGNGNDYINGGAGDDVIIAGAGDDFIEEPSGNDVYYFNAGNGNNSIMDNNGNNTIIFGDGISSDGIKAYRENWNDLLITFEGLTDTLVIKNYCIDETTRNFRLIFADGCAYAADDEDSALRSIDDKQGTEYMPSIYPDKNTTITSSNGDDELVGGDGADTLIGGTGNNRIIGNGGDDVLDGGAGKDYLCGGPGSDTYIYKKGYGTDSISDSEGINHIDISDYASAEVRAYRTNWNDITLVLDGSGEEGLYNDSTDKIVIEGFFTSEANRNYSISFSGSKYNATAVNSPLRIIYGTGNDDYMQGFDNNDITIYGEVGNDTLNGGNASDRLYGGEGDDRLLGYAGNDTLDGGVGNDYLEGAAGNDTYIFDIGYGIDTINDNQGVNTICFGEGITQEGLTAYRTNWNDLTITFAGTEDRIVLQGYFTSADNRKFNVRFADGCRYEYTDLENPINHVHASENDDWMSAWSDEGIFLNGMEGNDSLTGGAGNDILIGGAGNDMISGGVGDDIYQYSMGDGSDTITDVEGLNKILFGNVISTGITLSYEISGDEVKLIITINDTNENIVINNYNADNFIMEFADGIVGKAIFDSSEVSFVPESESQE